MRSIENAILVTTYLSIVRLQELTFYEKDAIGYVKDVADSRLAHLYYADLKIIGSPSISTLCSGSFINRGWVITLSDCVNGLTADAIYIEVFNFNRRVASRSHFQGIYNISDIFIQYSILGSITGYPINDFALLKLNVEMEQLEFPPVCKQLKQLKSKLFGFCKEYRSAKIRESEMVLQMRETIHFNVHTPDICPPNTVCTQFKTNTAECSIAPGSPLYEGGESICLNGIALEATKDNFMGSDVYYASTAYQYSWIQSVLSDQNSYNW